MALVKRRPRRKRETFRLEKHPGVHWPPGNEPNPPWVGPTSEFPDPLQITLGEVEIVEGDKHASRHLRLIGTYGGNPYRTSLGVEDPSLLKNLFELLRRRTGETIATIGSHRVDRSLKPVQTRPG